MKINDSKELIELRATVEKIIPISKENFVPKYILTIISSNHLQWSKEYTLDEINEFRNYLIWNAPYVNNYPFPPLAKSLFSFLPFIGHKFDERNSDILLQNKFILDDFFQTICYDRGLYHLDKFYQFFGYPPPEDKINDIIKTFEAFNDYD